MSITRLLCLSILSLSLLSPSTRRCCAADFTWDATGVSMVWGDGGNWVGGVAPDLTDMPFQSNNLMFGSSTNTTIHLNDDAVSPAVGKNTVHQMTWLEGAPAYTYLQSSGGTPAINFRGTGMTLENKSSNLQTFGITEVAIVGAVGDAGFLKATGGGFSFDRLWISNSVAVTYTGAFDTTIARLGLDRTNSTVKISTGVGGGGTLIIQGAAELTNSADKPFRIGNNTAGEGQYASIRILNGDALGTGSRQMIVQGNHNVNGRFELANNITFAKPIDLHGRSNNTSGGTPYDNSQNAAIWNFGGDNTINSTFTLTDSTTGTGNNFNFGSASGKLTVTSNLTFGSGGPTGAPMLTFQGLGNGEFSGAISGPNGVLKSGDGVLTLSGSNSYTGSTTIADGTLSATSPFFADTADISIAGGSILDLNYSGTDDVHYLYLNGVPQAPGLYGFGGAGGSFFSGTGMLNVLQLGPSLGLSGDFDGDGDVDGSDFIVWQTNFPTTSGATNSTGDADNDNDVDGADFAAWQSHFPTSPSPGASPVPEPSGLFLAAFTVVALCRRKLLHCFHIQNKSAKP